MSADPVGRRIPTRRCPLLRAPAGSAAAALSVDARPTVPYPVATVLLLPALALALPSFSVERGLYEAPFSVTLAPSVADATVTYGLDTAEPGRPYTGPIAITGTTVLRARETLADGTLSAVVTHTYVFADDIVTSSVMDPRITTDARYTTVLGETLRDLPWISLVIPGGITTAEQETSLEWFDPADGTSVGVGSGGRRVGGHSLYAYEKTSIRLVFRDEYGASRLHLDLYGDDATGVVPETSFDALTLRGGNHDSQFYLGAAGQHLRNLWMDETQLEMGHVAPHGRFAHLALNGAYYGLYHVRERFNAAMLADYLGGTEDDWEAITGGRAFDGSGAAWNQLVAVRGTYQEAKHWLNVGNFLDYMVLNYYAANSWDWSYDHNWIAVGPSEPDQGGFVFQSSDSDICLYYDANTNILYQPGPSEVFGYMNAEGDPDFEVALRDAIYRNLEGDGPLTASRARTRYARIAGLAEAPVVAESARWGLGWWDREAYWVPERDYLLNGWFPYRTDVMLGQFRAAGWYPVDGPTVDTPAGVVAAGTVVTASGDEVWVTRNGEDPRLAGGAVNPTALGPGAQALTLDHSTWVAARQRAGGEWGPVDRRFYEVDEAPPLILNEWNAVDDGERLDDDGADDAFGQVDGNGGDWIELVVIQDHLDLRGWRMTTEDRRMDRGTLAFTDDPLLADLRAGTIITIAEDLPEDPAYDPDGGDWRFHLRATAEGQYVRSDGFDVTAHDWQLTVWDPDGAVRYGPIGEAVAPWKGISGGEVGLLAADPSDTVGRTSADYRDGTISTFGSPNRWGDEAQDFWSLRQVAGSVTEVTDSGAGTTTEPDDTDPADPEDTPASTGCGCASAGGAAGWIPGLLGLLAVTRRRRGALLGVLLVGCAPTGPADSGPADPATSETDATDTAPPPTVPCPDGDAQGDPDAPEVCNGEDDDCDGAVDEDPVDGMPFYADADGDGYGDESQLVLACTVGAGATLQLGDCDDTDPAIHPGAAELCDGVDHDCDGLSGTDSGTAQACPAESCRALAEASPDAADGPRWLTLPSGTVTQVWCDIARGGWALGFLRNSAETGSQGQFGLGEVGLPALVGSPEEASSTSTPLMGWLDLNDYPYESFRLAGYTNGAETAISGEVSKGSLRLRFGEPGYLLYGGDTSYIWCGGPASYTDSGVGAVNNPPGATLDCKGHGSLGSGWDFSESTYGNAGLSLCGGDGTAAMSTIWGASNWIWYGSVGGAQAIWVR